MKFGRTLKRAQRFDMYSPDRIPAVGDIIQCRTTDTAYIVEDSHPVAYWRTDWTGVDSDGRYYWLDDRGGRHYRFMLTLTRVYLEDDDPDPDWRFERRR